MKLIHRCFYEPILNTSEQKTSIQFVLNFMIILIRIAQRFFDIVLVNIKVRNNREIISNCNNRQGLRITNINCYWFNISNRNQSMLGQTDYFKIKFKFIASGIRIIMASYVI